MPPTPMCGEGAFLGRECERVSGEGVRAARREGGGAMGRDGAAERGG